MPFYLSDYVGAGTRKDPFRPRGTGERWASIDLRPDCTVRDGFALVADERAPGIKLGDHPLDTFGYRLRNKIHNRVGVDISRVNRFDVLAAKLLLQPNGWKPLMPANWRYEIWLGELIWTMPLISGGAVDLFTRADAVLAFPWQQQSGSGHTSSIVSNGVQNPGSASDALYYYAGAAQTKEQWAQVTLETGTSEDAGPAVRIGSAGGFDAYVYTGGVASVAKIVASSFTGLATYALGTMVNPQLVRVSALGSSITTHFGDGNESVRLATGDTNPVTDTALAAAGNGVGFFQFDTGTAGRIDNFQGGDLKWQKVQSAHNDGGTGGSNPYPLAFPSNVTAGNLLIALVGSDNATMTVDDTTGHNSWALAQAQGDSGNDQKEALWWAVAAQSEAMTVRLTTAGIFRSIIVEEWMPVGGGTVSVDQKSGGSATTGNITTPSITPTRNSALVMAVAWNNAQKLNSTDSVEHPFLPQDFVAYDAGTPGDKDIGLASYFQTDKAAVTATFNFVAGGGQAGAIIADFVAQNWPFVNANGNAGLGVSLTGVVVGNLLVIGACGEPDNNIVLDASIGGTGVTLTEIERQKTANLQEFVLAIGIASATGTLTVNITDSLFALVNFSGAVAAQFQLPSAGTVTVVDHDKAYQNSVGAGTDLFAAPVVTADAAASLAVSLIGSDNGGIADLAAGTGSQLAAQTAYSGAGGDRLGLQFREVTSGDVLMPWSSTGGFLGEKFAAILKVGAAAAAKQTAFYSRGRTVGRR